jgi:hypothetical protein
MKPNSNIQLPYPLPMSPRIKTPNFNRVVNETDLEQELIP